MRKRYGDFVNVFEAALRFISISAKSAGDLLCSHKQSMMSPTEIIGRDAHFSTFHRRTISQVNLQEQPMKQESTHRYYWGYTFAP